MHKAAKIYVESMDLVESESVKEYGRNLWKESQQVIDETYSYLDSMRAYYDGAESVARKYENRCLVLNEYISDDLRLKLKKQE